MVIIIIRRFARIDREDAFLARFQDQAPRDNPDFLDEVLTRIDADAPIPRHIARAFVPVPGCVNFVNVARWRSWDGFARQFAPQLADTRGFDPAIEAAPAQIVVLDAGQGRAAA